MKIIISRSTTFINKTVLSLVCAQANTEALGAVHPVGEPAPGEPGGAGPAGQAAALRPPAEADGGGGHAAPILL